jgi:hypothetical protein
MVKGVIFGLDTLVTLPNNISEVREDKDKSRLFVALSLLGVQKCIYSKEPVSVMHNVISKMNMDHLINAIVSSVYTSGVEFVRAEGAKSLNLEPKECVIVALCNQFPGAKGIVYVENSNEVSADLLYKLTGDK